MFTSIVPLSKLVSGWEGEFQFARIEIKVSMFYINIYEGKPVIETLSQMHTQHSAHTHARTHARTHTHTHTHTHTQALI